MSLAFDHFPLFALLAALMSTFAALLWKDDPKDARRFFLKALLGLVASAVALGYLLQTVSR